MADSVYKWSLTASENDAADNSINWRENQLPDTVNDSARAMMMRVAELREDLTGGTVTAGTQPAYTLATKAAFDSLADGRYFTTRVHATNAAGAATLNVNGLGAKAIRKFGTSGDMPLGVGDLQLGGLYQFMYASTANAGAGGWVISNPSISTGGGFASGTQMLFMNAAAPVGWTKATTHDNKALRIVSGTGGASGGTMDFTTAFSATRIPLGSTTAVTLTTAMLPAHSHTQQGTFLSGQNDTDHSHAIGASTGTVSAFHSHATPFSSVSTGQSGTGPDITEQSYGSYKLSVQSGTENTNHTHYLSANTGTMSAYHKHSTTLTGATTDTGGDTAHSHPFTGSATDFGVKYVDSIICTKD